MKVYIFVIFFLGFASRGYSLESLIDWSGEYRFRGAGKLNYNPSDNSIDDIFFHRFLLGGEMKPNDIIGAHILLGVSQIAGSNKKGNLGLSSSESEDTKFQLIEAYGDWGFGNSFFLKFGRQRLDWGNEALISSNMDDQEVYSFDGLRAGYDSDKFNVSLGVFKVGEWAKAFSSANVTDPDESLYFATVEIKSIAPFLERMQPYFLRTVSDSFNRDTESFPKASLNRVGLSLKGNYGRFLYQADIESLQGNIADTTTVKAAMGNLELGWGYDLDNNAKVALLVHRESEDKGRAGVSGTYIPLYYNHHSFAGLMDIFAWGNLNYTGLKWQTQYKEKNQFLAQALFFDLASIQRGPGAISYLGYGLEDGYITKEIYENKNSINKKSLGMEIDFQYTRLFSSGAYLELIAGAFLSGKYMEAYGRDKELYYVRVTSGFSF